jgi:hypothetical protein
MNAHPRPDEAKLLVHAMPEFLEAQGIDPVTSRLIVPGLEYQLWIDGRPKRIPIGRNSGNPVFGGELVTQKQLAGRIGLVGVTGWNWTLRQTMFIILDFDAADHAAGHDQAVLDLVIEAARRLGWVWVRRSKGGRGIHLIAALSNPMPALTGTEHEQNAEAIMVRMTKEASFDFSQYLDCGGVVGYIWAPEVAANAFEVLVEPTRSAPDIGPAETSRRQSSCRSAEPSAELSEQHLADIKAMGAAGFIAHFSDGRLLCHSKGFEVLYQARSRPGSYRSRSAARNPSKPNAFAFPTDDGGWIVSRFGAKPEVEYDCWYANAAGFATARVRPTADSLLTIYKSYHQETTGEVDHVED